MTEIFKLSKDDIDIVASRDERYERIALIKITGKLIDTTLPVFLECMTILTNKNLCNVIIDCSDVMMIASSGWNSLLKRISIFKDSNGNIVLIRLKPFVFSLFKELKLDEQIPHYRTYGEAANYINQTDMITPKNEQSMSENVELPHGVVEEEVLEKPESDMSKDSESASQHAQHEEQQPAEESGAVEEMASTTDDLQKIAARAEESVASNTVEEEIDDMQDGAMVGEETFPLEKSRETEVITETTVEEIETSIPVPDIPSTNNNTVIVETIQPTQQNAVQTAPTQTSSAVDDTVALIRKKIIELKIGGYNTDTLDKLATGVPQQLITAFSDYMHTLNELQSLEKRFLATDRSMVPKEASALESLLKDPTQLENAKQLFNQIITLVDKHNRSAFNPLMEFNFDNFIKGECNKFAFDTAMHIAGGDAVHAPVFICGPNGTGKTHIVNAIGNRIMEISGRAVAYIPAQDYITSFENYTSVGTLSLFRDQYFGYEFLIFDDLHTYVNNLKALQELRYLYDKSIAAGKKILFTSTMRPEELTMFGNDFVSRLKTSIMLRLESPDGYTLSSIIKLKAQTENIMLDDGVYPIITEQADGDIRKALGILNTLKIYHDVYKQPITTLTASDILGISVVTAQLVLNIPEDDMMQASQESFETETSALYDMNSAQDRSAETVADGSVVAEHISVQPVDASEFDDSSIDVLEESDTQVSVDTDNPVLIEPSEITEQTEIQAIIAAEETIVPVFNPETPVVTDTPEEQAVIEPIEETVDVIEPDTGSGLTITDEAVMPANNEQDNASETEFESSQSDEADFLQIDTSGNGDDLFSDPSSQKTDDDDPFKF